jgi:hypothetical protein
MANRQVTLKQARQIVAEAREADPDRRRVYTDTDDFLVLVRYCPVPPGLLRNMRPRDRWNLLASFTNVQDEDDASTEQYPLKIVFSGCVPRETSPKEWELLGNYAKALGFNLWDLTEWDVAKVLSDSDVTTGAR